MCFSCMYVRCICCRIVWSLPHQSGFVGDALSMMIVPGFRTTLDMSEVLGFIRSMPLRSTMISVLRWWIFRKASQQCCLSLVPACASKFSAKMRRNAWNCFACHDRMIGEQNIGNLPARVIVHVANLLRQIIEQDPRSATYELIKLAAQPAPCTCSG